MLQFGEGKFGRAPVLVEGVIIIFNTVEHGMNCIHSLEGASREVARSAKSNFSGREWILVDDEALSFSRLSSER